jgi:hypothetical protein
MITKTFVILLQIALSVNIITAVCYGQRKSVSDSSSPTPCAVIRDQLDRAMAEFTQAGDPSKRDEYLIVIARPGRTESRKLTQRRLDALKSFFQLRRSTRNVIFAVSENRHDELGSTEIFIKGVLTERFFFKLNKWKLCDSVEESW